MTPPSRRAGRVTGRRRGGNGRSAAGAVGVEHEALGGTAQRSGKAGGEEAGVDGPGHGRVNGDLGGDADAEG